MNRESVISLNMYPQWVTELGQAWVKGATDLLAHNKLPLSGDVSQWISAWGEAVGQIGLFNINTVNSGNPRLERDIGINYSYGRQLGRMLDVLTPLVLASETKLIDEQKRKEYLTMVDDIQKLKDAKIRTKDDIVKDVDRWRAKLTNEEFEQRRQELIGLINALPAPPRLP